MVSMRKHIDGGSLVVILITFGPFAVAQSATLDEIHGALRR